MEENRHPREAKAVRRTTEDYLKTIYLLQKKSGGARGTDIARQLGVTKPTVSIIVKRLVTDGFATMDSEHEIYLTDEGRAVAQSVLERNETFRRLLEALGVDHEIAEADACKMEHAVSQESLTALKTLTAALNSEKYGETRR